MPQVYPYFVISDDTTTCTFQDGAGGVPNWALRSNTLQLAVPTFNPLALAGRGQYTDVVSEFYINVRGTDAPTCRANFDTLARLLDQASRWYYGENVAAVKLKVAPQGSTISTSAAPMQSVVLGRAQGDQTSVTPSPQWDEAGLFYEIPNVKVRVWHRMPWCFTTAQTASSASTNNGTIATVNLGAAQNTLSYTKLDMSGYPSAATDRGFLIVSSNDAYTRLAQADPSAGTAVGWTSVNDAANFARSTNVLRYTPTGTAESTSGSITLVTTGTPVQLAVFANIRNNSNTTYFFVRLQALISGGYITAYTPYNYIAPYASAAAPGWVRLGDVVLPSGSSTVRVLATASAAVGTLDFGDIVLVDTLYAGTYILAYTPSESNALTKNVVIDPAALTRLAPTTLGTYPFTVEGDMAVMTEKQNIAWVNLITDPAASNNWRQTFAGAVIANTMTLTRLPGYLDPL